jgi:hypothetical protein
MCEGHLKEDVEPPMMEGCEHKFDRDKCKFCPECGEGAWIENEDATISESQCPVCQFKAYCDGEMATYLLKTREVPRDEVFAKIKEANKRRKKLYDSEYITEVCARFSLNEDSLLAELKEKFTDFSEFTKFIRR